MQYKTSVLLEEGEKTVGRFDYLIMAKGKGNKGTEEQRNKNKNNVPTCPPKLQ